MEEVLTLLPTTVWDESINLSLVCMHAFHCKDSNKVLRLVSWTGMHQKVVGNFGSEADVRSLYYRRFRSSETSDVGACTHGRPAK